MLLLCMFIALIAMICLNVPIAVALAVSAVLGLFITEGYGSLVTIALDMYDGSTKFSLIAIPMFVLADTIDADAFQLYGGSGFPYTVMLNADGTVNARKSGSESAEQIKDWIDAALLV